MVAMARLNQGGYRHACMYCPGTTKALKFLHARTPARPHARMLARLHDRMSVLFVCWDIVRILLFHEHISFPGCMSYTSQNAGKTRDPFGELDVRARSLDLKDQRIRRP